MFLGPFTAQGNTIGLAVTTTSGATSVALPGRGETIRIVNEGPNIAYLSIGVGAQVATVPSAVVKATSTPVLAGTDTTFSVPDVANLQIAAICATGTAALDIQVGNGV